MWSAAGRRRDLARRHLHPGGRARPGPGPQRGTGSERGSHGTGRLGVRQRRAGRRPAVQRHLDLGKGHRGAGQGHRLRRGRRPGHQGPAWLSRCAGRGRGPERGRRGHLEQPDSDDRGHARDLLRRRHDRRGHLHRGRQRHRWVRRGRRPGHRRRTEPARRGGHRRLREPGDLRHRQPADPGGRGHVGHLLRARDDRRGHLHRGRQRHVRLRRGRRPGHRRRNARPRGGERGQRGKPGDCGQQQQPGPGGRGHLRHLLRAGHDRREHLHRGRHRHRGVRRGRRPGRRRGTVLPERDHRGRLGEPGHRRLLQQPHPGDRGHLRHLLRAGHDRREHLHRGRHRHLRLLRRRRPGRRRQRGLSPRRSRWTGRGTW